MNTNGFKILLLNDIINENEFKVYSVLANKCKRGERYTREILAEIVGFDKDTVTNCINNLKAVHAIDVISSPTPRGTFHNRYILRL